MKNEFSEKELFYKSILWNETDDVDFPYEAMVDGRKLRLRLNDFPDEPLFTLFIDEEEWGNFDDVPPVWTLP